jgi:glycosyltransferase involved in cell wall biosynthesis
MRYVYLKNGDAVAQVRRIRAGLVDRSGPDAFIGDFMRQHEGDSVLVLCQTPSSGFYADDGVRAFGLPVGKSSLMQPIRRFWAAMRAAWMICRERPDRIVCGMGGEFLWAAALAAAVLRVPMVATRHSGLVERAGLAGIPSLLSRASLRSCVGIACHGPFLADQVRRMGFDARRVFEFEVDLSRFGEGACERQAPPAFRQFAGQFQVRALYAGRIQRNKGVFDILQAFCAAAASTEADMGLVFVGGGDDLAGLQAAVAGCSAPHRILVLGRVDHEAVAAIMQGCSISICATRPPLLEGRCMAILESLVMGLPAVAPDFAAFPYAIDHGENGLLFRPGDVADLERSLLALANDPQLLEKIRAGAASSGGTIRKLDVGFAAAVDQAFHAGVLARVSGAATDRGHDAG